MNDDLFKGYKAFKIAQLCLLIGFGITFFCYLYFDPLLNHNIYTNRTLLTVVVFLWGFWIFSLISILWDFRQLERNIIDNYLLNKTAYLDELTGIPNRKSIDLILKKYDEADDISKTACALISLNNIEAINEQFGRNSGNACIRDFASAFERVGKKYGFVGRNGGNEFIIIMDNCDEDRMYDFLRDFSTEVGVINSKVEETPLIFSSVYVLNEREHAGTFRELISLLYREGIRG